MAVAYIKGLASEEFIVEVRQRVQRIRTDSVMSAGAIDEFIQDTHLSFFPLALHTERPDRVAGNLLGEAAIDAGFVSPSVTIVVAITAIASFILPTFSFDIPVPLLRFAFILAGGTMGLFGVQFGIVLTVVILSGRRSFGHPYLAPVGPMILGPWKDHFVKTWKWAALALTLCLTATISGCWDKREPNGMGSAVFRGDSMVGWLDGYEAPGGQFGQESECGHVVAREIARWGACEH